VKRALLEAGAAAVRFNAPLGDDRARRLVADALAEQPGLVVDFGCGQAELLLAIVDAGGPGVHGVGIDTNERALDVARETAAGRNLDQRLSFLAIDVRAYEGRADVALCIGASHAFGGLDPMLRHVNASRVLIGDAFWAAQPDAWSLATFGEFSRGLAEVKASASDVGWRVVDIDASTQDEWDAFEDGWCAGVAAVGTPDARALAAERASEYHDHYRGVLGFAWLVVDGIEFTDA
jgi:SAM-dependent methyltransferase